VISDNFGNHGLVPILKLHVRFGSKADIEARPGNVRFTPESGHFTPKVGVQPNVKA
jgi:hypothetical protein